MPTLSSNRYGKARVRLSKITRLETHHVFTEYTVDALLDGAFEATYIDGDNKDVLPTDTIKNTVYALAKSHSLSSPEAFALDLSEHYLKHAPAATQADVSISMRDWQRMSFAGDAHPFAYNGASQELRTTQVIRSKDSMAITGGIAELPILKTTDSAFVGFLKDEYTVLPEEQNRIMATKLTATWRYNTSGVDYNHCYTIIRTALLQCFADHQSESLQHTLFAMGTAALEACRAIESIHMVMPNVHNFPFDLGRFGIENKNEIFFPADEPHGYIEGTVTR